VGVVDDIVHLKPYAKLVAQIVLSTLFTTYGMRLHWLPSAVADQALTIFWLVGTTNAMNLLDNLDGAAGGIAAIAAGYLVYFSHVSSNSAVGVISAALCGAVVGFLVFNFNPASIFMGDGGSLFLGFLLGGITMVNNQDGARRHLLAVLLVPVLLMLIPIIDTSLVTISRKHNGRPVSQGGKDHTSHRLVALGFSERAAALTLWLLAAFSGGMAVLVTKLSWAIAMLAVPLFLTVLLCFAIFVGRVKIYEPISDRNERVGRALLPTLTDFAYKRRVFEVLSDLAMIVLAYYSAFLLRFEGVLVEPHYSLLLRSLPTVIVVQVAAFLSLGLYRGMWRYTSLSDLGSLVRAVAGAWSLSVLTLVVIYHLTGFSRAALVMDGVLLLVFTAGLRISFRLIHHQLTRFRPRPDARRVLIVGAGDGGEMLVRELMNNRELGLVPVGFVDDDPGKHGRRIHGIPVLGPVVRLAEYAGSERADEVVVSTGKLAPEALLDACRAAGLNTRRMRIAFD
jgi:UDP-GlcNAc:undecaprenyl-phosphate GlcNAc-1-phosphate transferase